MDTEFPLLLEHGAGAGVGVAQEHLGGKGHSPQATEKKHLTRINPNLAIKIRVRVRVGLRLGLGKSLFPVGTAKDQRLPAGPIATATVLNCVQ